MDHFNVRDVVVEQKMGNFFRGIFTQKNRVFGQDDILDGSPCFIADYNAWLMTPQNKVLILRELSAQKAIHRRCACQLCHYDLAVGLELIGII